MKSDIFYMKEAIKEATKAENINEIPVGAVLVDQEGKIIGKGYNKRESKNLTIGHAEIETVIKANKKKNNWRLIDCTLYVTLEPCEMCKKVIESARIEKVVYAIPNNHSHNSDNTNYKKIDNNEIIKEYEKMFKGSFKKIR